MNLDEWEQELLLVIVQGRIDRLYRGRERYEQGTPSWRLYCTQIAAVTLLLDKLVAEFGNGPGKVAGNDESTISSGAEDNCLSEQRPS